MFIRKEHAGSASTGHVWETDGAVVEVSPAVAGELLQHSPGEFTDVTEQVVAEREAAARKTAGQKKPPVE